MSDQTYPKIIGLKQQVRQTKKIQYEKYVVEVLVVDDIPMQAVLQWGDWFDNPNAEGIKHFLVDPKKTGAIIDLRQDDARKIVDALIALKQNG